MAVDDKDRALLAELRSRIADVLELVPAYNDDFSLMRWLIGWDRNLDVVIPKIRFSLRAIHALGLDKEDFSTIEKVTAYCDSVSKPLQWLPGSLIGLDKDHNVVSLQMIGRVDAQGLMPCTRNGDLYVMRIAESEGVMQIIRANEKRLGKQLGTTVIFDLDGMSMSMIDVSAMKVITTMLAQLQEMFPDVLRKVFIINAPGFIQMLWSMVSPCLAKQTQQKIQFLGADWKQVLRDSIGEEVLFERWGGSRKAETEFGNVRMGGKVPKEMRYDSSKDLPASELQRLSISARSINFVPITLEGYVPGRRLSWWWRLESGDIGFAIHRAALGHEKEAEHDEDYMVWPKFKLQTEFVPEAGVVAADEPGVYKFIFDNSHGKLWSKAVKYSIKIVDQNGDSNGDRTADGDEDFEDAVEEAIEVAEEA